MIGPDAVVAVLLGQCAAAGTSSSSTRRYGPAFSVVTSIGPGPWASARVKNRRAGIVLLGQQHVDDLPG
jgi:hypothetical protein